MRARTLAVVAALTTLPACGRDEVRIPSGILVSEAAMAVDVLVDSAMHAYRAANVLPGETGTVPVDRAINQSEDSSLGGRITVTGTVKGMVNVAEGSAALALDARQTISGYTFAASGVTYTVNGAPGVAASGSIATSDGGKAVSAKLKLTGAFSIARGTVSRTCPVAVDVETAGTGGVMRGTVCGEAVTRTL